MKFKPNSNLLTVADSPFPQRFVELLLFIYVIKNIDKILRDSPPAPSSRLRSFVAMVLGANAPHLTEESFDNETVRSDRFVSTLCRPNLATWRHKVSHEAMHAHDDSYRNQPVVQYIGPVQEDNKLYVKRKTGNNVVMELEYDPLRRRPKSLKTVLAEGQTEQNVAYTYDKKGNISSITDRLNESRSQSFEYDALNRVTKAIGKYGTEDYSYHSNGNMLQHGQFTLQYSNPNHVHAVTKVSSLQTGDTNFTYDTIGNLIERDGDVYRYNAMGKLAEITTAGGDVFQYSYDASGNRIKKQLKNANTTTYNFNNLYEIHRSPGEPEKHTLYIHGIEGDKVAQYTRSDALLVQANIEGICIPEAKCLPCGNSLQNKCSNLATQGKHGDIFDQRRNFLDAKHTLVSLFQEIESDIALVWFNIPKPKLLTDNYQMLPSMRVIIWLLAFGILIYYALTLNTQEAQSSRRLRLATSFALFPFFFATSTGCSPLIFGGAQGEEGTPPWLLLATVPGDTPSVSDEPNFFGGGSGASTTNSARITGMYFYHPDHLGSITMITDGRGNVLAGGERGGKSHITYRPYGEILRTDSFGPDISKFKYTGQEEDRESGLMFYKARYYDAKIGRFLQQDSMAFPNQVQGMNRMMYVEGNPVGFRDPSGNAKFIDFMSAVASTLNQPLSNELLVYATFATGKGKKTARDLAFVNVTLSFLSGSENYGFSNLSNTDQKNLFYLLARTDTGAKIGNAFRKIFRSIDHSLRKVTSSIDHITKSINKGVSGAFRVMVKGADGGARWLASGGKFSRNNGNDLDHLYSQIGIDTRGFFMSIQRSDIGRAVTKINQEPCISFAAAVAFALSPAGEMLEALGAAKFGKDAWDIYSYSNGGSQAAGCIQSMDWSLSVPASSL